MKRLVPVVIFAIAGLLLPPSLKAVPATAKAVQNPENKVAEAKKSLILQTDVSVEGLSESKQKRLKYQVRKLEKKINKRTSKSKTDNDFTNVFSERYFILGTIFVLSGIALAVLGAITTLSFFGWLGGIAVLVGLVLIIIAILQAT